MVPDPLDPGSSDGLGKASARRPSNATLADAAPSLPALEAALAATAAVRNARRLEAVRATGLLDAAAEPAFDRLTRLAMRLLGVPSAFFSLVDDTRDFYVSECGFDEPLASDRELKGTTFCHHAIRSHSPLVIPDTAGDPVYRDVPTVRSLGVAAYVGIPVVVDGQAIGSFCVIDTVPRPWTANEVEILVELAASAEREIALRGAAFAAADANRAKSQFLASMSHELRTPLNAILGYRQLLEAEVQGPLTPGQRDYLARLGRAQEHLLTLINDVLQFAKLEAGEARLEITRVDIAKVCARLDDLVRPQLGKKSVRYTCELLPHRASVTPQEGLAAAAEPLLAMGDPDRVLQILVNLVTNAVKFTASGGEVRVRADRAGSRVRLHVVDTGTGIAAEHLGTIFEPFVQVGHSRSTREGVGLGLAIARELARKMGGDVSVASEVGAGSTFTLELPAEDPSRP